MPRLSAAHYGYNHQDCVTAYALATILLPRFDNKSVTVDRKVLPDDRFDDLQIAGRTRRRIQIKSHKGDVRRIQTSDFTTGRISFRIDEAIRSFIDDPNPADEYRLLASFDLPETNLLSFLQPTPDIAPLLPGLPTRRYRLNPAMIWPEGIQPEWPHIGNFSRDFFLAFCDRFVVEVNCPRASGDLRNPGLLERALLVLLHERIGLGIWPNHNRDLPDAAAHLIQAASFARSNGATFDEKTIVDILALRIDYGRVNENFPFEESRLVPQVDAVKDLTSILASNPRLAITGSPGIGKSWLLHEFASVLNADGWTVALHYCYIDVFDPDRALRASIDTVFGNILVQLLEKEPSLSTDAVPRFAAGPRELEKVLSDGIQRKPDRRVAIIVDGLDHADRLPNSSRPGLATEIAQELAALQIPAGVALIVGSQPGDHLNPFLTIGAEYRVPRWNHGSIMRLSNRMRLKKILKEFGLDGEYDRIQEVIINRSAGNPLYATYLNKTVFSIVQSKDPGSIYDIPEYLTTAPALDQDLDAYYQWLFDGFARDTGAIWIGELLSLADFPLSASEIKQIRPEFSHHVDDVLSHLSPILIEDVALGGIRIYHESFQRYMSRLMEANPHANTAVILKPVIDWLDNRGFFSDIRAFRSLLKLLNKAGRDDEVISRIKDDYVINAIAYGQPADAVQSNLSLAASIAATYQLWATLARFVELSRAAYHFYQWRLDDHNTAEQYGKTFSNIYGPKALSNRLLNNNGRCTFPARPGIILCQICDDGGVIPPWIEYREAHDVQMRKDNTIFSEDNKTTIQVARLIGRFRLNGREQSINECIQWLNSSADLPVHHGDIAWTLGLMYGPDALLDVISSIQKGLGRSWAYLTLAQLSENDEESKRYAENAIIDGLPPEGWRSCLEEGADPELLPKNVLNLNELTARVISEDIQFHEEVLAHWITAIEVADALGDETALIQAEINIPSDSWFHRWLRFCLILVRSRSTLDELTFALEELSQNIHVFEGKPRASDLYGLHEEIRGSFQAVLSFLDNDHWPGALKALKDISIHTSTWLQGARTGPLPLDEFLELCLSTADTKEKRRLSSTFGIDLLTPEKRGAEYYDTHAQDQLLLVRLLLASGESELAAKAWREACLYLSSYGERKDITVYELLDPLEALASVDPQRVRRCFFDIQPVIERILSHTDGSETNHAIHKWLDLAADVHPAGALSYLFHDGIGRLPSFGDLDHAIPNALASLEGQIDPALLLAGWIAAGSETRSHMNKALLSCENAFRLNSNIGRIAWNVIVACLEGDGFDPPDELQTLAAESAKRTGLSAPFIENTSPQKETKAENHKDGILSTNLGHNPLVPPVFPATSTPIQITHGVRVWRDSRRQRTDIESLTNAVGWRLLELIHAGNESVAEVILCQIARDLPPWDAEIFLPYIADGLALHGVNRLASLASILAYTRARDGWRSFAGQKAINLFKRALELDPSVAWSTLANEVSERVALGGDYGVNVHLIELLLAGGRVEEAFATWASACNTITLRVPSTGPQDDIEIPYNYEVNEASDMLVAAIFARINNCYLHEKRLAVAAAALIINADPLSFGSALKFACSENIPASTLITLLQVMDHYEPEPYPVTQIIAEELRAITTGNLVSARVLARSLLERAGFETPIPPPFDLPSTPEISEDRASAMKGWIGKDRVNQVEMIWPEFGHRVTAYIDGLLKSEELKEKMQRALRRIDGNRRGRNTQVWLPADEEVERGVQIMGTTVRTAMAKYGVLDPSIEEAVGLRLLGNIEISVRMMYSRIIRPEYLPSSHVIPQPSSTITEPINVPDGEFADWLILAHHETELLIGDDYEKTVIGKQKFYSGLQFSSDWDPNESLPLGYGQLVVWHSRLPPPIVHVPFHGPLAGLNFARDTFGAIELIAPHPNVLVAGHLSPAPSDYGLTLVDAHGSPAVVCKYWRQRLISTLYMADQVPKIQGMLLLIRPDILKTVSDYALDHLTYAIYTDIEHFDEHQ